tara:strand:- start:80 stop:406 length:327 start_codon:yes stop_codon:yes gene_type:complete
MFLTKGKYRNKKLLEMAKESPYCMNPTCGKDNNGDVVAAHLNFDKSKGMATKANDYLIAYLCYKCHTLVDEGYSLSKDEKHDLMFKAFINTLRWLFTTERIRIGKGKN